MIIISITYQMGFLKPVSVVKKAKTIQKTDWEIINDQEKKNNPG